MIFPFILRCVVFDNFLTNPLVTENAKLNLALAIPPSALIATANDEIEIVPLVSDKTIKVLSK